MRSLGSVAGGVASGADRMTAYFYRFDCIGRDTVARSLPADLKMRCWQPDLDGFPPPRSRRPSNLFWCALARIGGFARGGFAELRIELNGETLHRLIVTPAWYRFPFMSRGDLQIGDVWTAPSARRRQLARMAIAEAHRRFGTKCARFWYVTDASNEPSAALAQSCGYHLVAVGRRTHGFGIGLLGQYRIEQLV